MKMKTYFFCMLLAAGFLSACSADVETLSGLKRSDFQTEVNGQMTDLYVLKNSRGMEVCVTNYGARVVSVMVPDRDGQMEDVVCAFPCIADYLEYPQIRDLFDTEKRATVSHESEKRAMPSHKFMTPPERIVSRLSFSHIREIMTEKDPLGRFFYETESLLSTKNGQD